ncbi:MAG TPA: CBS domain-containing protein [Vicinamibacterales bacterium]|nr:CBS domain-containing protein [Vicinamibacterales bacterium]
MKVKDLMTKEPKTCTPDTTLAAAAQLILDANCGILPVVDDGEMVGVVNDHDMDIALAAQNIRATHVRVGAVARTMVATCEPDDTVHTALATMRQARVPCLPVVECGRTVVGILSIGDILRAAGPDRAVSEAQVEDVRQAIDAHHHPGPDVNAA